MKGKRKNGLEAFSRLGTVEKVCTLEAKDVVAERDKHQTSLFIPTLSLTLTFSHCRVIDIPSLSQF